MTEEQKSPVNPKAAFMIKEFSKLIGDDSSIAKAILATVANSFLDGSSLELLSVVGDFGKRRHVINSRSN